MVALFTIISVKISSAEGASFKLTELKFQLTLRHKPCYNIEYVMSQAAAREIVGFAGSGPIFETENRFISRQEAQKSVHKTPYFARFCNIDTDIITCQNCSHLLFGLILHNRDRK